MRASAFLVATLLLASACGSGLWLGSSTAPSPTPTYKAQILELRRDFDSVTATLREASGSDTAAEYEYAQKTARNAVTMRMINLESAVDAFPSEGRVGQARGYLLGALTLVRSSIAAFGSIRTGPQAMRVAVRDYLNQADAAWLRQRTSTLNGAAGIRAFRMAANGARPRQTAALSGCTSAAPVTATPDPSAIAAAVCFGASVRTRGLRPRQPRPVRSRVSFE